MNSNPSNWYVPGLAIKINDWRSLEKVDVRPLEEGVTDLIYAAKNVWLT